MRGECIDTVLVLSGLSILQTAFSADSNMRFFSFSDKESKDFFSSTHCPCPSGKTSWSISSLWRQLGIPSHSVELLSFLPFLHFFRRIHLARRKKIICLLHMGLQRKSLAPERHMLPTPFFSILERESLPQKRIFLLKDKKKNYLPELAVALRG